MLATRFRSLLLATLFLAPAGILEAQVTGGSRPAATAVAAAVAPVVDGRLDDDAWREAQVLSGMVQREPLEGTPVSERTEVRIVYDDEALYVGAWLYDGRPESLVFGQTLRDASLDDADAFLVVLDTYRDGQNGFAFGTTPAGIEYDGQFSNEGGGGGGGRGGGIGRQQSGSGGGFNLNWDGSWEVATTTDGEGWYAEMRIPFATLRYGEGGPQTWGLNFQRNIRRNNELSVWAPLPRQFEVYRVSLAGSLDLQAPTSRIATVSPYVLSDVFKDYSVASPEADF
ncbi:MAG: carbohydrate binding family 9 domain-containing protein, partial [Gemmatimonadota bacterium]|nr:carbohydrate binding family 9 domain-containing protein [Gemmatimonadota bacterium]